MEMIIVGVSIIFGCLMVGQIGIPVLFFGLARFIQPEQPILTWFVRLPAVLAFSWFPAVFVSTSFSLYYVRPSLWIIVLSIILSSLSTLWVILNYLGLLWVYPPQQLVWDWSLFLIYFSAWQSMLQLKAIKYMLALSAKILNVNLNEEA